MPPLNTLLFRHLLHITAEYLLLELERLWLEHFGALRHRRHKLLFTLLREVIVACDRGLSSKNLSLDLGFFLQ